MGKTKIVQLSDEQREELEEGRRNGKSHDFRERCQMILLKSEKVMQRFIFPSMIYQSKSGLRKTDRAEITGQKRF